jgi:hypothetical protein
MAKKDIRYQLGEVCKWSRDHQVVFRYVDIYQSNQTTSSLSHQTISLPEEEARKLVNYMANSR